MIAKPVIWKFYGDCDGKHALGVFSTIAESQEFG